MDSLQQSELFKIIGICVSVILATTAIVSWFYVRHIANINSKSEAEKAKLEFEKSQLESKVKEFERIESANYQSNNVAQSGKILKEILSLARKHEKRLKNLNLPPDKPADIGSSIKPIFRCPRCFSEDVEGAEFQTIIVMDILCIENEVEKEWRFNKVTSTAELFFKGRNGESETIEFALDGLDASTLSEGSHKNYGWFIYSRKAMNENSVLKLQYSKGEERIISLYWINYAIEGYIEAKLHEFTNDWDLDVTLRNVSKKTA